MSKNYIERIYNNGINIKIHKDGKVCTLTNPNSIKVLLNICHKNNRYFKNRNIIDNADNIIKEFDTYRLNKNKKIIVMPDNINKLVDKIKLVKRMPTRGKIVITVGLATTLGISGINISSIIKNSKEAHIHTPIATIEEVPEYIDDFEDVEMSAPNSYLGNMSDNLVINYDPEDIEEIIVDDNGAIEIDNKELNQMLQPDEFHFSYKDRTNEGSLDNAKRYEDLFIKYGDMYGVDPNLLMAIAAQESSGDHYNHLSGGAAMGIMQIEKSVWIGHSVSAYNFETDEIDKVKITQDGLEDLETNIKVGTMIWRNRIEENNYNIPIGTQGYNYGPGNMDKVFNSFSYDTGITKGELKDDYSNADWLKYRDAVSVGDPLYVEHVFSYIENGTTLTIKKRDGDIVKLKIVNDEVSEKQMA